MTEEKFMHLLKISVAAVLCALFASCSVTPPKSQRVTNHPLLYRDGGVLLVADVCIQHDALGDAHDYFVITEGKAGAQALLDAVREYLENNGIQVSAELIPFVCGARHDSNSLQLSFANQVNGDISVGQQPFGVFDEIKDDPDYVNALSTASTYTFQYAMMPSVRANAGSNESSSQPPTQLVSSKEFKTAIAQIASRTRASSVLFLSVAGTSISSGKKAMRAVGDFTVGMAIGLATAGLGTGYYVMFISGHPDGMLMAGALIDLKTGALVWSNAVSASGKRQSS
ncbi:MAG: hypothetical protein ACUZ77_07270 [Candidatus Brocadiales bacterium]